MVVAQRVDGVELGGLLGGQLFAELLLVLERDRLTGGLCGAQLDAQHGEEGEDGVLGLGSLTVVAAGPVLTPGGGVAVLAGLVLGAVTVLAHVVIVTAEPVHIVIGAVKALISVFCIPVAVVGVGAGIIIRTGRLRSGCAVIGHVRAGEVLKRLFRAAPSGAAALRLGDDTLHAAVDLYVLVAIGHDGVRRAVDLDVVIAGEIRLARRLGGVLVLGRDIYVPAEALKAAAQPVRILARGAVVILRRGGAVFRFRFGLFVRGVNRVVGLHAVQPAGEAGLSQGLVDYLPGAGYSLPLGGLAGVKVRVLGQDALKAEIAGISIGIVICQVV